MIVNKATGERYSEQAIGASIVLVSASTGIQRVISSFDKKLFMRRRGECVMHVREESEIIPDLVRSLYLECKYLENQDQKVFLSF